MAEVWRGQHVGTRVPVAVKFVTARHLHRSGYREEFENEVRAVAMMSHPAIVRVYDYGVIEARHGDPTFLQARDGLPYLVMEYASLGSLDDVALPLGWPEVRTILRSLLEALAHAHARGIVHRDIKPANVLLDGVWGRGPLIRLGDFGIARHVTGSGVAGAQEQGVCGTPQYMAPEQFYGRWREFGPWTDLYALGCVAYQLATGRPPFTAASPVMLFMAHQNEPFPTVTDAGFPEGLNAWLLQMTAKSPRERFQHAADALRALRALPGEEGDLQRLILEETWRRSETWENQTQIDSTTGETLLLDTAEGPGAERAGALSYAATTNDSPGPTASRSTAAIPEQWRQPAGSMRGLDMLLQGASLGLYGLRAIPLVGRLEERDRLWRRLREVATTGRPAMVLIDGPSGFGKSRLARWLVERTEELGVARGLSAAYYVAPTSHGGLAAMIHRHLRTEGLDYDELVAHLSGLFQGQDVSPYELEALAMMLAQGRGVDGGPRIQDRQERTSLYARLLSRIAHKPLVLWLDDLQWGMEAVELVEHLLTKHPSIPVLVVGTVADEAMMARPEEAAAIEALLGHGDAERVTLGPLDGSTQRELVEELLGLESELATEVVNRTAGNPFFAVQLVGDWVHRDILEAGPRGYVVRKGETVVLPTDIHRLWKQRYESLRTGHRPEHIVALEIAALVGQEIEADLWYAACELARGQASAELLADLFRDRLIIGTRARWSFAHAMLRETIEQSAREHGRWTAHHEVIARVLLERYVAGSPDLDERLANHLVACGHHEEAARLYLEACRGVERRNEYARALLLSRRGLEALTEAGVDDSDPRYGFLGILRVSVFLAILRADELRRELERLGPHLDRPGWEPVKARAVEFEARRSRYRGELMHCEELFDQARQVYQSQSDRDGVARCAEGKAWSLVLRGRLDEAEALYGFALLTFADIAEQRVLADCLNGLSEIHRRRQRYDRAVEILAEDIALCQHIGYSRGMLDCFNSMAEIRREQGDFDAAETLYEEALSFGQTIGMGRPAAGELNLALIQIGRGHFARAQVSLERLLERHGGGTNKMLVGAVCASLCACLAARGEWQTAMEHLETCQAALAEEHLHEPDIASTLEIAAELAIKQHRHREARKLIELALGQWRELGAPGKIQILEQRLSGLVSHDEP
jgi:eukaryotic-like serine/threonine-protein kinase